MSETAAARPVLAKYCLGFGIDIGFGGTKITPTAITFDLPKGYCPSLEGHKQIMKGDCRSLSFFCDEVFDFIYNSHILEDFRYKELPAIINEWRRVLKPSGLLVINCPDQQKFLKHCAQTGQPINRAHKEQDFSLENFRKYVINKTGPWEEVFVEPVAGPYSWYLVVKKI